MKWVYAIKYKLQAALVLTIIVFLVFAKNIMDKRNMTELGKDFISFYEDRLVVESYIFRITEQLFLMKLSVNNPIEDKELLEKEIASYHTNILDLVEDFEATKLTKDEAFHLEQFKQMILNSLNFTNNGFLIQTPSGKHAKDAFNNNFEEAFMEIKVLSEIQLEEGEKLTRESGQIVDRSGLWTQLEMAVLVILLVIIYLLIFSSKSIKTKIRQQPSLN